MSPEWEGIAAAARRAQAAANEPWCGYIYDLEILRQHASALVATLPANCDLFYAIKANSDYPILDTLAPLVAGFEIASGGELAWVRARCPHLPVVFGGPGKTDAELVQALEANLEYIHVESMGELTRLGLLARQHEVSQAILLRINLPLGQAHDVPLAMGGRATPFGIDAALLPECLQRLESFPELRLEGVHFHLMSGQLDAAVHLRLLEHYFRTLEGWERAHGLSVRHVNVGGGIGVNYRDPGRPFDWPGFARGLHELIGRMDLSRWRIRFEIGRYLTASCGAYAMEVLDIKRCFGRTFVVGRGGTHHFRTPYAQGHNHPFFVLPIDRWSRPYPRLAATDEPVTIVGQLCTPKDVLAADISVDQVRVGDLLIFTLAGAYAWHISHHDFLRHPHPEQIFLSEQESLSVAAE